MSVALSVYKVWKGKMDDVRIPSAVVLQPVEVEVKEQVLEIGWSDGHRGLYPHKFLRESCPCAMCQGESGLFGRAYVPPKPVAPAGIKPLRIGQVGRYAVSVQWSDGHSSGIYMFTYLREICQCDECRARKTRVPPEA